MPAITKDSSFGRPTGNEAYSGVIVEKIWPVKQKPKQTSVLWRCLLGSRKDIWHVKTSVLMKKVLRET